MTKFLFTDFSRYDRLNLYVQRRIFIMKCISCGTENADSMKFCTNCGSPLNHTAPVSEPVSENAQATTTGFNQQNMQSQTMTQPQNQFYGQPMGRPQNQFHGQPQINPQNQFNGQPMGNPQNQFNGQPQVNPQNQFGGQPGFGPQGQPPVMDKAQFFNLPNLKRCRSYITGSAIMMYVSAGLTFLVNVLLAENIFGLLDVFILLGLGLGIHLGKSRVCSIITCVYACFNLIYMIIAEGTPGGTLIVIASILAIIYTFKYQGAWEKYQRTGMLPTV